MKNIVAGLVLISLLGGGYFFFSQNSDEAKNKSCTKIISAFDIGSGTTKLKVSKVDACSRKILETITYMTSPVAYAQDLKEHNGVYSEKIMTYGTKAMERFLIAAKNFKSDKILGVATSAFRRARNGVQLINSWNKKFGLNFRVIDQREEALIGYDSVKLNHNEKYAVWDIGGGSMQIVENTDGTPFIYLGNIASVPFKNKVIEEIKEAKTYSPNPMTQSEFDESVILSQKLFNSEINSNKLKYFAPGIKFVGIGGLHKSLLPQGKNSYSYEDMEERAKFYIGKTDKEINSKYSDTMVSNIALVMGFMKLFKIDRVEVQDVVLSDGLIYQELINSVQVR